MLTDYDNKVLTPDTKRKDTETCLMCGGKEWRKITRGKKRYLICKGCGRVREDR